MTSEEMLNYLEQFSGKQLNEVILPFWRNHAVDNDRGGFYGQINNDMSVINVVFSSAVDEKEIYDAVNVDQIKKIQLAELEYSAFLATNLKATEKKNEGGQLKVDSAVIDKMLSYLDELKIRVHG